jgi:hypothetical protein
MVELCLVLIRQVAVAQWLNNRLSFLWSTVQIQPPLTPGANAIKLFTDVSYKFL